MPCYPALRKVIYHWFASSVDICAYRVVSARPAHVQVRPVPWLDQTDEITALALREETIALTIFTHVYDRLNKTPIRILNVAFSSWLLGYVSAMCYMLPLNAKKINFKIKFKKI